MSARKPTFVEPVVVSQFWKNRRHDAVVVSLRSFEGRDFLDVRTHAMKDGKLVPTAKGVTVAIPRIPELAQAVTKALGQARDLGLLHGAEE
jgi:hypothetical protein